MKSRREKWSKKRDEKKESRGVGTSWQEEQRVREGRESERAHPERDEEDGNEVGRVEHRHERE